MKLRPKRLSTVVLLAAAAVLVALVYRASDRTGEYWLSRPAYSTADEMGKDLEDAWNGGSSEQELAWKNQQGYVMGNVSAAR